MIHVLSKAYKKLTDCYLILTCDGTNALLRLLTIFKYFLTRRMSGKKKKVLFLESDKKQK